MARTNRPAQVEAWAAARLAELDQERQALLQLFPGLVVTRSPRQSSIDRPSATPHAQASRGRRRGTMSAAARKAVSLRMTRYWAERRKAASTKGRKATGAK